MPLIEQVHYDVHKIQDDPLGRFRAGYVPDALIEGSAVFADIVGHRSHLAVGRAGADHEIIGDRADFPQVHDDDIVAVAFVRQSGRGDGQLAGPVPCSRSLAGHQNLPFGQSMPSSEPTCGAYLTTRPAKTTETMLMSLIRMFRLGPEVSLNGSPTVSPTTVAL